MKKVLIGTVKTYCAIINKRRINEFVLVDSARRHSQNPDRRFCGDGCAAEDFSQEHVYLRVRLEVSVVAQASPPASEGGVSPPSWSSHRDGAGTRRRDGCATGLTDGFNRTLYLIRVLPVFCRYWSLAMRVVSAMR